MTPSKTLASSFATRGAALRLAFVLLTGPGLAVATASDPTGKASRSWDFTADAPGTIAQGFTNEVGRWVVVDDGANHVLAQLAKNPDETFNVTLVEHSRYRDLDVSVRLRAFAGELDQGGGLVWRARDARNYYIARYNPLENNLRVYKVESGKRTQFQSVTIPGDRQWHTLRVTMQGDHIRCDFDGVRMLDVRDSTFPDAGRIGLWTKSDAQSQFDDLVVSGE